MNIALTSALVCGCFIAAVLVGMRIQRRLPHHHLSADTKDTVKLAMGLVATMSALLLGLLITSAKSSYDATRGLVVQMAAKTAFLDRVLVAYGAESTDVRVQFRALVEEAVLGMWPGAEGRPIQLAPNVSAGDAFYEALQQLSPHDDRQRSLKTKATSLAEDLAQIRTLLLVQSAPSISTPLLVVIVSWLVLIFLSFSLLAPSNATATLAMIISACSVAGAVFLILQLDRPFGGIIKIPSAPMVNAMSHLAK